MEPLTDFTPADNLNLNRLNLGFSSLQGQVSDGTLYPEEAAGPLQEIEQERQGLLQRKQAAESQAMQRQAEMAAHQAAQQQSIQLANAKHSAENFTQMMPRFERQAGDNGMYFYPDGKGGFQPLDNPKPEEPADIHPDVQQTLSTGVETPEAGGQPPPDATPAAPGEFKQWIQNGAYGHFAVFQGNQLQRIEYPRDQNGREIKAPWEEAADQSQSVQSATAEGLKLGLSKADMESVKAQARLQVPPPAMTGNRAHDATSLLHYNDNLARATAHLVQNAFAQRTAKAKEAADAAKLEAKQTAELTTKQKLDLYNAKLKELQHDHDAHVKDGTLKDAPLHLADREAMEEEAHKRAEREYKRFYGGGATTKGATPGTSLASQPSANGAATPPAAQAPALPPVLAKKSIGELQDELDRQTKGPGTVDRIRDEVKKPRPRGFVR